MKKRILSLLLSLLLCLEAAPLLGLRAAATAIGVAPGVVCDGTTKQAVATAASGSLAACSYDQSGRQLETRVWPVAGRTPVDVSPLFTTQAATVRLFLLDEEGRPLSEAPTVEEGSTLEPGRTDSLLTQERPTVLADGAIVETGGAFPDGSTLTVVRDPAPAPVTQEGQEPVSPEEPDHPTVLTYAIRDTLTITATGPDGQILQPRDSAGGPETVCLRMDLSDLPEEELEQTCPMYYDENLQQWVEPEAYYLDREARELVILTDHFSTWARCSKEEKPDTPGRYDRYTWRDWSSVNLSSLPRSVTDKMMALYDQHRRETSYGWLADGLASMNEVTGSPIFDQFCNLMNGLSTLKYDLCQCTYMDTVNQTLSKVGLVGAGISVAKEISVKGIRHPSTAMTAANATMAALGAAFPILGPGILAAGVAKYAIDAVVEAVTGKRDGNLDRLHTAYYKSEFYTGVQGGRSAGYWRKKVLDPMYRKDRANFPQAMQKTLDAYAMQFWRDYGNDTFYLQLAETIEGNSLWGGKVPNINEYDRPLFQKHYKWELMEPLEPLVLSYINRLNRDTQLDYSRMCEAQTRAMNRLVKITISEEPVQGEGGSKFYATTGGYVLVHGQDKAVWSAPFEAQEDGSSRAVLDFRLKSFLALPQESRYVLDLCDRKGKVLGTIDLREDVSSDPNSEGIGPGRDVPYSCGPFAPTAELTVKALDDEGNPMKDLAHCVCQIYDGKDWPTNHMALMGGNGRAVIRLPLEQYLKLTKPLHLRVYLTNEETSQGTPSWRFPISGFGDAEFTIQSQGTCRLRVQPQKNAEKAYAGCLAVLHEKGKEGIGNQFLRLNGSGSGSFALSIEKLRRMGWPDSLSVYDETVSENEVNWGEAVAMTQVHFDLQPGVLARTIYLAKPLEGGPEQEKDALEITNVDETGAISMVQFETFRFRLEETGPSELVIESSNPAIAKVEDKSVLGVAPGSATLVFTKGQVVREVQVQVRVIPQYIPLDGLWEVRLSYVENHLHPGAATLAEGESGGTEPENSLFYVGVRGDIVPRPDGTLRIQGFNTYLMKKYVQTPGSQRTYMKKFRETGYDSRYYQPVLYYDNEGYLVAPTDPDDVVDLYSDACGTLIRRVDYDQMGYLIQEYTLNRVVAIDGKSPDFLYYLEDAYKDYAEQEK